MRYVPPLNFRAKLIMLRKNKKLENLRRTDSDLSQVTDFSETAELLKKYDEHVPSHVNKKNGKKA
jgi:hypothetical protein